ncbi:MAG: Asp23/Gls24 family envelope stress response protein [Oscillospiraceae bacterium]|nr:Asp23/Gls24 family envelope stress response protein [Oscillospiraceae bacterium]
MGHHDSGDFSQGGLVISDEVLAAIAVTAAKDVEGVSALAPRANVRRLFRTDSALNYVKLEGSETELTLALSLRIHSGAKISSVAGKVQREIKNAVQGMTGRTVTCVNIHIAGADFN